MAILTEAQIAALPLEQQLAYYKAANEELKRSQAGSVSFKVSEKGAISCYGLGRLPVTLYFSQWERLIAVIDKLKAFMAANRSKCVFKPSK